MRLRFPPLRSVFQAMNSWNRLEWHVSVGNGYMGHVDQEYIMRNTYAQKHVHVLWKRKYVYACVFDLYLCLMITSQLVRFDWGGSIYALEHAQVAAACQVQILRRSVFTREEETTLVKKSGIPGKRPPLKKGVRGYTLSHMRDTKRIAAVPLSSGVLLEMCCVRGVHVRAYILLSYAICDSS